MVCDCREVAEEDAGSELWNFMRVKVAGKEYLVDTEVEVDHDDTSATDFSTMTDGGTDDDDDHVCFFFLLFFQLLLLVLIALKRSKTLTRTNQTTFARRLPQTTLHPSQTSHPQERFVPLPLHHQAEHSTKKTGEKKVPFHVSIEITFDIRVLEHHRTWYKG